MALRIGLIGDEGCEWESGSVDTEQMNESLQADSSYIFVRLAMSSA